MDHLFDEFSKSLAESVPRRESLRRLGAIFAGAVLSPLGMGTAWAGRRDPCQAFCKCRTAKQQSQCLAACRACNGNTGRIGGSCGEIRLLLDRRLRRGVQRPAARPELRGLRKQLPRPGGDLLRRSLRRPRHRRLQLRKLRSRVCRASSERIRRVRLRHVRLRLRRRRHPLQRHLHPVGSDPDNCGACGNVCGGSTPYCNGGECSHANRGVRFAVAFAPTWTLTTPTAERAASFALRSSPANLVSAKAITIN